MFRKSILMGFICFFMAAAILAQTEKPLPAGKVMEQAYAKSKETGKNVFLLFHASWCGWCKKLEKAMGNDEMKKIFEKNYVITYLDVLENGDKVAQLENPDGKALMDKLGGAKSGIPFYAFITKDGKTLATSNVMPKDQNIGYPGSKEELEAFMKILKIGAPKMSDAEAKTISEFLKKDAAAPAAH